MKDTTTKVSIIPPGLVSVPLWGDDIGPEGLHQ